MVLPQDLCTGGALHPEEHPTSSKLFPAWLVPSLPPGLGSIATFSGPPWTLGLKFSLLRHARHLTLLLSSQEMILLPFLMALSRLPALYL